MAYQVTDKSTVHGQGTPHGYGTPHKWPSDGEDSNTTTFIGLAKQLYPTGRAFALPENGIFESFHKAMNVSLIRMVDQAKAVIDAAIPDNESFTEADAAFLEAKFGLTVNPATDLENRKAAIKRKMAYPSNIRARQNPLFIEAQLQLAGFDVHVYENRFLEDGEYVYKTPDEISAMSLVQTQHGDIQHGGGSQHGSSEFNIIANEDSLSESFSIGGNENLWATFYISGPTIESQATIPKDRQREFKELVLKLKPAHTVAYLFINFI